MSIEVSRMFIGLGLPILQGYGMTECSPVACVNSLDNNVPSSVGRVIPGITVKLDENNALLQQLLPQTGGSTLVIWPVSMAK